MLKQPFHQRLRYRISKRFFGGEAGGVFRGMATLLMGSGIGRLIGIATIPILTRLYSPEDFGTLSVFTALVAILAPLVTLRYVLAFPLPRQEKEAMNLLAVSVALMLALSALITFVLLLWGEALLGLMSMEVLAPWWWLIALGVLGTATYEMFSMWATRCRDYKVIAQTNVIQSVAGAVVKIGLGLASLQPLGLLIGQIVAQAGGISRFLRVFFSEFSSSWHYINLKRIQKTAWRHRGFPIWRVPSQFFLVFSQQAPVVFAASLFSAALAGQLGLALSVIGMPLTLIGGAMGKALYGEASRIYLDDPLKVVRMAQMTQRRLLAIGLLPTVILILFGEEIFSFTFGAEWSVSGFFASILSIALLFQFSSAPLIQLTNILSSQYIYLLINGVRLLGVVLVFVITKYYSLSEFWFVVMYSVLNLFFYFGVSFFVISVIRGLKK